MISICYLTIATEYDGVVATNGRASIAAISVVKRPRGSDRRAILMIGRRLDDLLQSYPNLSPFDYVVAENGEVVYEPRTHEVTLFAQRLPPKIIDRLKELGVKPRFHGAKRTQGRSGSPPRDPFSDSLPTHGRPVGYARPLGSPASMSRRHFVRLRKCIGQRISKGGP